MKLKSLYVFQVLIVVTNTQNITDILLLTDVTQPAFQPS